MYVWECPKCGRRVKWDGKGEEPITSCEGKVLRKHKIIQMPIVKMPNDVQSN